jgi:chromosome segregation ATPase
MEQYLPILNITGFIILAFSMWYSQWKTGTGNGTKVAAEVIETYKTQVQQLREELAGEQEARRADLAAERKGREDDRHDLKNRITGLALQLENMKGANTEKDKKIVELTEMLQGRNPEQEQYMESMRQFTQGVAVYMRDSAEILNGLRIFMSELNRKSQTNQTRNENIDASTVKNRGHLLRKEK